MKVQKSAEQYAEAAEDEIKILAHTAKIARSREAPSRVVELMDYFVHKTDTGARHMCMVFEVCGPSILNLLKKYDFKGVPMEIVRKVAVDCLLGLDHIHRKCGIIHTDLKPENVLVACPRGVPVDKYGKPLVTKADALAAASRKNVVQKPDEEPEADVDEDPQDIANLTKAQRRRRRRKQNQKAKKEQREQAPKFEPPEYVRPTMKRSNSDPSLLSSYGFAAQMHKMQTQPLYDHFSQPWPEPEPKLPTDVAKCFPSAEDIDDVADDDFNMFDYPEVTFKVADLGNACWTTKHFADEIQTRQYRAPEVILRADYDTGADMWSLACMLFELAVGDYLFDPKKLQTSTGVIPREEEHLAQMMEVLGPMPRTLLSGAAAPEYFNPDGSLVHISELAPRNLLMVLTRKHQMHPEIAGPFFEFLMPMLHLDPSRRCTADEMLQHPWLRTPIVEPCTLLPPLLDDGQALERASSCGMGSGASEATAAATERERESSEEQLVTDRERESEDGRAASADL